MVLEQQPHIHGENLFLASSSRSLRLTFTNSLQAFLVVPVLYKDGRASSENEKKIQNELLKSIPTRNLLNRLRSKKMFMNCFPKVDNIQRPELLQSFNSKRRQSSNVFWSTTMYSHRNTFHMYKIWTYFYGVK